MALAEINLLPERKKRNVTMILVVLGGLLLILGSYGYLFVQYHNTKAHLVTEKELLQQLEQLREIEQVKLAALQTSSAAAQLISIVSWVEQVPLPTVELLRSLTSFLPERGFFSSFAYKEDGKIQVEVQFDQISEVASYLHHLTASPLIEEAWLANVKLEEPSISSSSLPQQLLPRYAAEFNLIINAEEVAALKGAD